MAFIAITQGQTNAITVGSSVVKLFTQLSSAVQNNVNLAGADISVQTNDIYVRYDGSNLVSPNGMLLKAGTIFRLNTRTDVLNCLMVQASAAATVVVTPLQSQ